MTETDIALWQRGVGVLILLLVIAGYVLSWRAGKWPPSHPWSGIALTIIAINQLLPWSSRVVMSAPGFGVPILVLYLLPAVFWIVACVLSLRAA